MSYIKGRVVKSSAPTSSDDSSKGYYVGFKWVDSSGSKTSYECYDDSVSAAVWRPTNTSPSSTPKIACCPFGAKSDGTGNFLIANGKSSDADDSTKPKTRQAIGEDGTLTKLVYQTKEGTTSTQMKIHINGVVEATVVLSSLNANFGGVEAISVSVSAGDYVEIEYDSSDKPGECTMYFIQELS